jgi:signal transduction histidine kinase
MIWKLVAWFVPADRLVNRTDRELASSFVFTHIFGPLSAQPMWIYLWTISAGFDPTLIVLLVGTSCFWLLPFLLRFTGRIRLSAMLSFQLLAVTSLFASYHYGGFNSPFMPWLIVSLLLGFFYLNKEALAVLAVFGIDVLVFIALVSLHPSESRVPVEQLSILGWLSITSATIYVTWMAWTYSRIVGMRSELEAEAERSRVTFVRLEEARGRTEELVRTRARFFSKVSHELRTPLNAIIGYSEILIEDLEDSDNENDARVRDVSRIITAGKHLLSLVSRVLDSKSIEKNEEYLDIGRVQLGELCDEVVATALPMVEKNGNRFTIHCIQRDYVLTSDATRLRQVLINLLSNAAKFTSNGVVRLELDVIEEESGDILRAAVADTGVGISEEGISRIFRSYEQAEADTVAKYGGTGIGLPLSQHFCQLLGGEITVASRPGQGSTFTAWVPAHYRPAVAPRSGEGIETGAAKPNLNASRPKGPRVALEGLSA